MEDKKPYEYNGKGIGGMEEQVRAALRVRVPDGLADRVYAATVEGLGEREVIGRIGFGWQKVIGLAVAAIVVVGVSVMIFVGSGDTSNGVADGVASVVGDDTVLNEMIDQLVNENTVEDIDAELVLLAMDIDKMDMAICDDTSRTLWEDGDVLSDDILLIEDRLLRF